MHIKLLANYLNQQLILIFKRQVTQLQWNAVTIIAVAVFYGKYNSLILLGRKPA